MNKKNNLENTQRLDWVDNLKGIGMILVILGHVSINKYLNDIIYSFHMPLFFIISGFLFNFSNKDNYVLKKVKSLIVPYFKFCFIWFMYWFIFERFIRGGNISITQQFFNIFIAKGGAENYYYNAVMWFLPCLLITEITFYYLKRVINNEKIIYLVVIVFSLLGYLNSKYNSLRFPWLIDVMLTSIGFYAVGYYILPKYNNLKMESSKSIINVVIFIFMLSVPNYIGRFDLNANIIPNYYMLYIFGTLGTILIVNISKNINLKIIKYIGMNSLFIMCMHEPIKRIVIKVTSIFTKIEEDFIRNNFIWIIIISIILISVLLFIKYLIDNYFIKKNKDITIYEIGVK